MLLLLLLLLLLLKDSRRCLGTTYCSLNMSLQVAVAAATCISSLIGAIFYFIPWLKYDFDYIKRLVKVIFYVNYYTKTKTTVVDCFEKAARLHPARPFLKFDDEVYTYGEMQKQINKVANMAVAMGLKKDDIVAIIMYNEPAYLWTWMGRYNKLSVCYM